MARNLPCICAKGMIDPFCPRCGSQEHRDLVMGKSQTTEGKSQTTVDPWRETVRSIFDWLILSSRPFSSLERRILDIIEERHHDYFCEGKTMAEWEKEKSGWQPIETAPKDGTSILLYCAGYFHGGFGVGFWQRNIPHPRWCMAGYEPSHWMPLPEPPQTGSVTL